MNNRLLLRQNNQYKNNPPTTYNHTTEQNISSNCFQAIDNRQHVTARAGTRETDPVSPRLTLAPCLGTISQPQLILWGS